MSEMLALAWNSKRATGLRNTSAGIQKSATWRQVVRIREEEEKQLGPVLADYKDDKRNEKVPTWKPRSGTMYRNTENPRHPFFDVIYGISILGRDIA
ncbi:MAG: hypothetical protein Q9190_001328 [Brigantiaea leucoxantha]